MKEYKVPIFTEEYFIEVAIGTKAEIQRLLKKLTGKVEVMEGFRGHAYNFFPKWNPTIVIDGDLPTFEALATLAHESSHAMDFIRDYIGLEDKSGEFHGHGIAAVLREVGKGKKKLSRKKL